MEQLLKELGYTTEQIEKIISGMQKQKIYTSKEENIDDRYTKLKKQKEDLEKDLESASNTIKDIKKDNKEVEDLQIKIAGYEKTLKEKKLLGLRRKKSSKLDLG